MARPSSNVLRPPVDYSDSGGVYRELHRYHDGKIGFVIFRTVYDDDIKWAQFMDRMTKFAHWSLGEDSNNSGHDYGSKLKEVFAYEVREDKSTLEGASKSEVRRIFNDWSTSVRGSPNQPKCEQCILANEEVVESVLKGETPWSTEKPRGYVVLINRDHTEPPAVTEDEEYPAVEGSKAYDLGWMKQYACCLFPRTYRLLMHSGWYQEYRRPPSIRDD